MAKRCPFRFAANQPDIGQVGLPALALQAGCQHIKIFCMAEAHDQHPGLGRQALNRSLHRLRMLANHLPGYINRKHAVAAINPGQ